MSKDMHIPLDKSYMNFVHQLHKFHWHTHIQVIMKLSDNNVLVDKRYKQMILLGRKYQLHREMELRENIVSNMI